MFEGLPREYDVIVVGTGNEQFLFHGHERHLLVCLGMVESILAAACARSGKSVLHIDT